MEYRIALDRMEFRALHGCYELERKVGNRFTVDLELTALLGEAHRLEAGAAAGRKTRPRERHAGEVTDTTGGQAAACPPVSHSKQRT